MRLLPFAALWFLLLLCGGCLKDDTPLVAINDFSGITERNEWGDTLSVDSEDWVIDALVIPETGSGTILLPHFRNGVRLAGGEIFQREQDDLDYSIGAFPNPFILVTGRLIITLVLLEQHDVEFHIENPAGDLNFFLFSATLSAGIHTIVWDGTYEDVVLPEGIYRLFFDAGLITSFGDVEVILSSQPDPATNTDFVLFAYQNYDTSQYLAHEYQVAADFGWDGQPGGDDTYALPLSSWLLLDYTEKFSYLPVFMNYDVLAAEPFEYHYLIAYKHFQFGAGWPESSHYIEDPIDTTRAEWQYQNYAHDTYLELYEGNP